MEENKVSVIIPIYKVEKFIERCVRSLMEQTLQDVEYIFVDDATPDESIEILEGCYTWWSYMFNARANNAGWRIDYFLVSDRISKDIKHAYIYSDIMGSDHCPVGLELEND